MDNVGYNVAKDREHHDLRTDLQLIELINVKSSASVLQELKLQD